MASRAEGALAVGSYALVHAGGDLFCYAREHSGRRFAVVLNLGHERQEFDAAGEGYSSFAVSNGRLFTLGGRQGTEYVMAIDAASGKQVWSVANGRRFDNDRGSGPRVER